MYVFYIIALLPVIIGLPFYLLSVKFTWIEWLIVTAVSFALAGLFQIISFYGLTTDYETWSGQITTAKHYSAWEEYYEYAVYRTEYYTEEETETDSKGNEHTVTVEKSRQVFDHWEPTTRWHPDDYRWWSSIDTDYNITVDQFNYIVGKFGDVHPVAGDRTTGEHASHMISGDPNDYVSDNKTGWVQPVTKEVEFENRIKATRTVFSFVPPTLEQQKSLFQYPENKNPYQSDRVLGIAKNTINILAWDQMNARLGSSKKVNLIIIGFNSPDSMLSQEQESLYLRGKKNDLVLCFGQGWTRVFGWTEKAIVERKLETILLNNPIDNSIIPLIEKEVQTDYVLKPWKKFSYIAVDPPPMNYLYYLITLILIESGVFYWAMVNDLNKDDSDSGVSEGADKFVEQMIGYDPLSNKSNLTNYKKEVKLKHTKNYE